MNRQDFEPYIRDLADRMGLRDWTILLGLEDSPRAGSQAATFMTYGQRRAKVYLSGEFLIDTPEGQRSTLVHELLHPHFAAMDGIVCDVLNDDQQKPYNRMYEYGLDAVAVAIAPLLPLPPHGGS